MYSDMSKVSFHYSYIHENIFSYLQLPGCKVSPFTDEYDLKEVLSYVLLYSMTLAHL